MLVSEIFVVTDCIKYDDGHTGNPIWDNYYNVTATRQTEDTILQSTSSSNGNARIDGFNGNYCIEFDFKSNGGCYPQFRQDTTIQGRIYWSTYEDNNYHHIIINITGNQVTGTIDGNNFTSQTLSGAWNRFYLNVASGNSISYKNLEIYPI